MYTSVAIKMSMHMCMSMSVKVFTSLARMTSHPVHFKHEC